MNNKGVIDEKREKTKRVEIRGNKKRNYTYFACSDGNCTSYTRRYKYSNVNRLEPVF